MRHIAETPADPFHPAGTFSLTGHARQLEDAMKGSKTPVKKPRDLSPKSTDEVKGGAINLNDSITMVRAAKPAAKPRDLPSKKNPKGGYKRP